MATVVTHTPEHIPMRLAFLDGRPKRMLIPDVASMVRVCDVVTINCPLHPETEHMFNDQLMAQMKRGAYLVNTARGKICDRDAIVRALTSGQLAGYAGDVWFPQPAPQDHPWRTMPHHGMTPHTSGTSLSAQARYAAGVREILECWFAGRPIREEYLIVDGGRLAGMGAHSYSAGNATEGADEAVRFTTGVEQGRSVLVHHRTTQRISHPEELACDAAIWGV